MSDNGIQLDYEIANQARSDSLDPDLNLVLPKLARRIKKDTVNKTQENNKEVLNTNTSTNTKNARRGSSIAFTPGAELTPEVQALRKKDIQPDANSAALRALVKASRAASIQLEKGSLVTPQKKRDSLPQLDTVSENLGDRKVDDDIDKTTGTKVEGREIQQGHAQYALTYGMMLGIRVTTGRKYKVQPNSSPSPRAALSRSASARPKSIKKFSLRTKSSRSYRSNIDSSKENFDDDDEDDDGLGNTYKVDQEAEKNGETLIALEEHDYTAALELIFEPSGGTCGGRNIFPTPPHKLAFPFKFKDYMANAFRAVRYLSGIDEAEYMMSLAGDFNYIEFIANSKSGQFFFYSHDGKYMIKTQTKEEAILLRNIMPEYVEHLYNNPDSLLVRFYGMHRVKMKSLDRKIHFVIMSSVFDTDLLVHTKYDLKGSTIGRLTDAASCAAGAVQKDLNFMNSNRKIRLGPTNIKKFYDTLRADTRFLEKMNIMDYSLLIGIHDRKNADSSLNGNASNGNQAAKQTQVPNKANSSSKLPGRRRSSGVVLSSSVINNLENTRVTPTSHGVAKAFSFPHSPDTASEAHKSFYTGNNPAENNVCENESVPSSIFCSCDGGIASYAEDTDNNEGDETYFMGIIDILQLYNTGKKMETFFKGLSQDKTQLSSVNPSMYANRMVDFIMKSTDYEDTRHIHGGAAQAARRKK